MIRIIQGIYGYKSVNGTIEPKTSKDAPFSLTEKQEARLVKLGVAEYTEVAPVQPEAAVSNDADGESVLTGTISKEQLEEMNYSELKHLAKEMGVSAVGSKDELVERIALEMVQCGAEEDDSELTDEADTEEPPVLEAADPE